MRKVKLPQIQNVGSGQRATLRIPLGRTYNKITLCMEGNINRTLIKNLVLKLNIGEKIRWKTGLQLQARNAYLNGASDVSFLVLNLLEPDGIDIAAMQMGTYGATAEAGVQDLVLEFDIDAYTVTAGSKISAIAEVELPTENRLIQRLRFQQKTLSGAVEEQIIIPFGVNGEQVKRMYIFGTLALIDFVRIRRDDSDEFESITVLQNEFDQKDYGRVPQAGLMVVDFMVNHLASDALNTALIRGPKGLQPVQNLDIRMTVNGAGTFDIYVESLALNDRS